MITVHVTGPIEAAKEMMKVTRPHNVMMPATLGAAVTAPVRRDDEPKGGSQHGQADFHPEQSAQQQLAPPPAVHKGERDDGGGDVDATDGPCRQSRLGREAKPAEAKIWFA